MRELELKFSLTPALQAALEREAAADPDTARERVLSRYYDTPDGALVTARMAVRVRRHGERWLQTLKADTGDHFERFEWERPVAGPVPERGALPPPDTPQGAIAHGSFERWQALFETDFERTSRRLEPVPGLAVELAQDIGEVRCAGESEPIREVELECLEGSRDAFFAWALEWAHDTGACLLMPTKNERGLRLAHRLPPLPPAVRSVPASPAGDAPGGGAAASVLGTCIGQFCANLEPVLRADGPEGPHQMRVALRRLRAALRFFGLREQDAAWTALDHDAAALAAIAGHVRDVDVFEAGLLHVLHERFPDDDALRELSHAVADARDAARVELRRTLASPPATQFLLRALALAERLAGPAAGAGLPAGDFAALAGSRIHALQATLRKRARAARDEMGWHRTRIAVKNLRYALEFSAQALPRGADPLRAAALLALWQEQLGAGQDLVTARNVASDAMARPGVPPEAAARAIALIDGWQALATVPPSGRRRAARRTLRDVREALGPASGDGGTGHEAPDRVQ
jgi:triphosphatase